MSPASRPRNANVTLRLDADTLLWARARAFYGGTSVNALIRGFLEEYAAVPDAWRAGLPPPWTPEARIVEVMDPLGAGLRRAERQAAAVRDARAPHQR
jgi:hypothetical protein